MNFVVYILHKIQKLSRIGNRPKGITTYKYKNGEMFGKNLYDPGLGKYPLDMTPEVWSTEEKSFCFELYSN